MSDDTKPHITRGKVAIVDKHGAPLRPRKHDENGVINEPSDEFMDAPVTRGEMLEALPKAALAIGQKMFDQVTQETAEQLARMEHIITQRVTERVVAELSRRFNLPQDVVAESAPALVVEEDAHETLAARGLPNPVAVEIDAQLPPRPDAGIITGVTEQ